MSRKNQDESNAKREHKEEPVLIVGIGASAGGLSAFTEFLSHTPAESGIGFVLLPHLDPKHKSLMTELLAVQTTMPVLSIKQGQKVLANHVYVLPPGKGVGIVNGDLQVLEPDSPAYRWTAVDQFFSSLAEDQGERVAGVILSGTGSHGVLGLSEIKLAGGIVLAQSIDSSEYQQMPENAINSGLVDRVLAPAEMPAVLIDYARRFQLQRSKNGAIDPEDIYPVLNILRSRTKFDFRNYRKNMLIRRIQRRMGLRQIDTLDEYQEQLRDDPEEVSVLNKDLLIGVTAFFRDPEAFHLLEQRVVPELVAANSDGESIRIWVPACSTGEEAYSLAMLFFEEFKNAEKPPNVQIFATDIDEQALAVARQGVYTGSLLADVSEHRLNQFFEKVGDDKFQVRKALRDSLVFASQSVIRDAPFSHLNLISCRNLLIYLEPEMQERVIKLFHFALEDNAYLLLGPSESLGRESENFKVLSKKWRLFKRLHSGKRGVVGFQIGGSPQPRQLTPTVSSTSSRNAESNLSNLTLKTLLADYAPASVLINRHYQILQFYGPTMNYLDLPSGEPTNDLMALLRTGLNSRIRALVHRARQDLLPVVDHNARVQRAGHYVRCTLTARPVSDPNQASHLLLLSFEDNDIEVRSIDEAGQDSQVVEAESIKDLQIVEQLEYELRAARKDLQVNADEMESSREELKSANEEMMSMNEELQAANEELETSKEELQSMNEELNTANAELLSKVEELEVSHDDISNLLASTDIATLFIDRMLQIQLFNPPTAELLNLRLTDIDRPISDVNGRVDSVDFLSDAAEVLSKLARVERVVSSLPTEAKADSQRSYLRRMVPYRASNNRIGGVVVTFVDITERYQQEKLLERRVDERTQELQRRNQQLRLVLQAARAAVWEMDQNRNRDMVWQVSDLTMFGVPPVSANDTENWWLHRIHPDERQSVVNSLERAITGDDQHAELQYRFRMADGSYHWMSDLAHISRSSSGHFLRIDGAMIDINEQKLLEFALAEREMRLAAIMECASEPLIVINKDGVISEFNTAAEQAFGYGVNELQAINISQLIPMDRREKYKQVIDAYSPTNTSIFMNQRREFLGRRKDGSRFPLDFSIAEIAQFKEFVGFARDLTKQRLLEQEITSISTWEQEKTGRELHDGLGQRLTGLNMMAAHIKKSLQKKELPEAELIGDIVVHLKEAAAEVTRISHGLAPVSITPDGLTDALKRLVEPFENSEVVNCRFSSSIRNISAISNVNNAAVANQFYRIAQESLNNALKYAKAKNIELSLTNNENGLELCVNDDGIGFDMQELMKLDGFGVRIMHYRAQSIGAVLSIETSPGKGARICCCYQGFPDGG